MKAYFPQIDAYKFVLSLCVVAIHAGLWPSVLYPWLRLAVPSFFLMSSYFFFCNPTSDRYKSFVLRLLKMYVAWFVILLPITLNLRKDTWFASWGWLRFLSDLMFTSTFATSWFFAALLLAVTVVYFARRFMNIGVLCLLSVVLYAFCSLCSSYPDVVSASPFLSALKRYHCMVAAPQFCVTAALLPVSLGAFIARHSFMSMLKPIAWWMFIVFGCIVLYAEWCYVGQRGHGIGNDCYFSLPLVYVPLFMFVKSVQIELDCAKLLRLFSIVVFPMHFSVNSLTVGVLKFLGLQGYISPLLLFWVGVGSAAAVCFAIVQFEKRGVNALKWLH